jgi:rare lipoprotein A (peptidoglycan hydrolase)
MKLSLAFSLPIAALMLPGGAMADPLSERLSPEATVASVSSEGAGKSETADTIVQIARVAANTLVAPPLVQHAAETTSPLSAAESAPPAGAMPVQPAVTPARAVKQAIAAKPEKRPVRSAHERVAAASPALRVVGKTETGSAAWYGGRYVGRRTTSGEKLDAVHATAAHRTLPLNCLARVTNLRNGRSVVVRVTDRGPVGHSLLIDVSPHAADLLQMKAAGVVPVRVEQVVELPPDGK